MKDKKLPKNTLFHKTCSGMRCERAPVWLMRQAGRYLPEYRAIRQKHSFLEMYKDPSLACEVTLQPIDILDVDAAIIFSDILVIPEACGLGLSFVENKGPQFDRVLESPDQLEMFKDVFNVEKLSFVYDTISLVQRGLSDEKALIGFAGSPWTLVTYMVEGGVSKNFSRSKEILYEKPEFMHNVLSFLTDVTILYCVQQITAGVNVIQIFDSWAGLLSEDLYETYSLSYVRKIFDALRSYGVPLIYFGRGVSVWLDQLSGLNTDVLSLDWQLSLESIRKVIPDNMVLQGNFDPSCLYLSPDKIRLKVKDMIRSHNKPSKHIINLGHGVFPDIPVEHVKAFVDSAKEESYKFYNEQRV